MSVINQMLKDLEQRSPESGQTTIPVIAAKKTSPLKIVLLISIILLSLNALGFYIWNLQERVAISEAKQQNAMNTERVGQVLASQPVSVQKLAAQESNQEQQQKPNHSPKVSQALPSQETNSQLTKTQKPYTQDQHTQKQSQQSSLHTLPKKLKPSVQSISNEPAHKPTVIKPSIVKPLIVKSSTKELSTVEKAKTSQMSVSRRHFTPKELVEQKLARAEKSVNINEITKAEQLFEEILIIDPDHKQARKKLAALWFGRKSYQQAVNLLSQGIAIDKQDGELRLMKARIHLKQGHHESAYNTLKPLSSLEQEEYQVMLANIAQQIEQYKGAIVAYQVLIRMQPYSGRWHLGLGIVYDKNSQFSLAVNEYALALTKADLSASSAKFAEQRMQALGE